ncbi:MAG: Zn-dependent hydrolase [Actinomycetia bacterium]|nr:Zn-dependent hydrolase [Actinomycetes bacterium]
MTLAPPGGLRIDRARLLSRLTELGSIGAIEGTTGCSRLALTDADRGGRDLVRTWMDHLGLHVTVDGIGNVIASTSPHGGAGAVMMGSHIDTVATGGRYDGNLGVLAGLEIIETVVGAGLDLSRPLAVGFFTNEEGSRFAPDMMGSLVYVGGLPLETALATTGIDEAVVADELDRIGYLGTAPVPGAVPHAFVELHIEQGPILEAEDYRIGVVEGVQGISWTELSIEGQSNHAGTTPMHLRHDPGYVASRIATFVRELAVEAGGALVATVGALTLEPNLINVVPARATMTVDLRNTDEEALAGAEARVVGFVAEVAKAEGVEVTSRTLARFEPVVFAPEVVDLVEQAAVDQGLACRRLPSGAGHDAQMLARVCPTAMIFVPSVGGVSHNPAEHTDPDDLEAGANVLLSTALALAGPS